MFMAESKVCNHLAMYKTQFGFIVFIRYNKLTHAFIFLHNLLLAQDIIIQTNSSTKI